MGKLLLFLSFMCLVFLGVGVVLFPQDSLFWIASASPLYQHVREVLGLVLLLQLFTKPPRHIWIRIFPGVIAMAVGLWTVEATYAYQMLFLDTLSFLAASIAIGVTALEPRIDKLAVKSPAKNKLAFKS